MGGPGSGRHRHSDAKSTTDDYRSLDVRFLAREGMLMPGHSGSVSWTRNGEAVASIVVRCEEDHVILTYRHRCGGDDWTDEEYPVRFARTPCHLGGSRPWFICPAKGCGRRVAILYGGGIFACRHCYRLAHASSREDASGRAMRQADRLRARLGWESGIANPKGGKPKWMRWRTFESLAAQHDRLVTQSFLTLALRLGIPQPGGEENQTGSYVDGPQTLSASKRTPSPSVRHPSGRTP